MSKHLLKITNVHKYFLSIVSINKCSSKAHSDTHVHLASNLRYQCPWVLLEYVSDYVQSLSTKMQYSSAALHFVTHHDQLISLYSRQQDVKKIATTLNILQSIVSFHWMRLHINNNCVMKQSWVQNTSHPQRSLATRISLLSPEYVNNYSLMHYVRSRRMIVVPQIGGRPS